MAIVVKNNCDCCPPTVCEGCSTCCMYPANNLVEELPAVPDEYGYLFGKYLDTDLPDAITLNGVSFSRSGSSYGNTTNGVIWESSVWAIYVNGVRTTSNCLISGDGNYTPGNDRVEDQFAATYEVIYGYDNTDPNLAQPLSYTVTRISLCEWYHREEFEEGTADAIYLNYGGDSWYILREIYDAEGNTNYSVVDSKRSGFVEENQPLNSPVGNYVYLNYFTVTATP